MNAPETMLDIDIEYRSAATSIPNKNDISHWASTAYSGNTRGEVAMLIVDEDEIQSLNHNYRNKNQTTNVLSFSADLPAIDGFIHLGDLVLCANIIEREAKQQEKSLESHWAHMTIHGMLHLQNYDHISDTDAQAMEEIEIALMASLGFSNPYLSDHDATTQMTSNS